MTTAGQICPTCGAILPNHEVYCPSYAQTQGVNNHNAPVSFLKANGFPNGIPQPTNVKNMIEDKSKDMEPVEEEPLKYLKVKCPRCHEMPGYPCKFKRLKDNTLISEIDFFAIHIARVLLFEVYQLGTVNEMGVPKSQIISGRGKE
jgi:ribosomal protein S27AE